jgi:hypothetical protein
MPASSRPADQPATEFSPIAPTPEASPSSGPDVGDYSDASDASRVYGARMAMTHALITTAQAPIARGPLQAIRLRVRRLALECAG